MNNRGRSRLPRDEFSEMTSCSKGNAPATASPAGAFVNGGAADVARTLISAVGAGAALSDRDRHRDVSSKESMRGCAFRVERWVQKGRETPALAFEFRAVHPEARALHKTLFLSGPCVAALT